MSSSEFAISARGLGKSYVIEHRERQSTAAETLLSYLANPFRPASRERVWSLQDVSFDVKRGDIVGVIGRNGAGKSTLLKLLSRITEPSRGEVRIAGRVGSLIEVGTGFQPELTGRENIFLNGAILGMRRNEIQRRFDEIVDFSGVEKYLDTPVKRYSSGMYVRLAFAVAAHLDTDILFVDEVLSVGDAEFQRKCLGRLGDVANTGRTILFVSHNAATLEALCTTGLLFEKGRLLRQGPLASVLSDYHDMARADLIEPSGNDRPVALSARHRYFRNVDILDAAGRSTRVLPMGSSLHLRMLIDARDGTLDYPTVEIMFRNTMGQYVMGLRSPNNGGAIHRLDGLCEVNCRVDRLPFVPGDYTVTAELLKGGASLEKTDIEIGFMVRNADTFADGWGACTVGTCVAPSHWQVAMARPEALAS